MTDHTDMGFQLSYFVFDDNNQERQSWKSFRQTCNWSLVVFKSQIFCNTADFSLYPKIYISWELGGATVWVDFLSSTVGYNLPSPK